MSHSWQGNLSHVSLLASPSLFKCTRLLLPGGLKREALPWENPVDEPFSSGKDASSQQPCTMYCARILTVLILSIYRKLLKPGRFLHGCSWLLQKLPWQYKFLVNWQGMKSHRLSLPHAHGLLVGQQRSPGCLCPLGKVGGKGILNLRHFKRNQEDTDITHKKMLPLIKQKTASLPLPHDNQEESQNIISLGWTPCCWQD